MMKEKTSVKKTVRDIRRHTRKQYSAEEKIRIVLEGLRGEDSIADVAPFFTDFIMNSIHPDDGINTV
jgi:transposase-like protein